MLLLVVVTATTRIDAPPIGVLVALAVPLIAVGLRREITRQRLASGVEIEQMAKRMAAMVVDNQRLAAEAATATLEVQRSRSRIVATVERERRRIERDLHDGAQQRLVALRIELELVEDLVRRDPRGGIARLKVLEREVDETLDEVRSLAHGVCPPLLADRGIGEAVRAVAARSPLPVDVDVREVGRYAPEVEGAVYFCIVEALQNVLKHAGASRVEIRIDGVRKPALQFSVRDDGGGMRDRSLPSGVGLTNMRDRLAAVGGTLDVGSAADVGTTVRGSMPLAGQLSN